MKICVSRTRELMSSLGDYRVKGVDSYSHFLQILSKKSFWSLVKSVSHLSFLRSCPILKASQ